MKKLLINFLKLRYFNLVIIFYSVKLKSVFEYDDLSVTIALILINTNNV